MRVRVIDIEATPEEAAVVGTALQSAGFQVQMPVAVPVSIQAVPAAPAAPKMLPQASNKPVRVPRKKMDAEASASTPLPELKPDSLGARVLGIIGPDRALAASEIMDELRYRNVDATPAGLGNALKSLDSRGLVKSVVGGRWKKS